MDMQRVAAPEGNEGPLHGIKVLDLCSVIAGPYGCTLLGDLGAEVIKIEAPAGDAIRQYPSTLEKENRAFVGINRNKLSLVLDLKDPAGLAVLRRLVRDADVLVHNFRPSVPPRLGIAYEQLCKDNPRLIYCAVTGFGDSGPYRDKAGYDQVLQAMTGLCALQGASPDKPQIVWGSVVDYYTASQLAFAVSSALFHRERTGRGQAIGVSLLQAALTMQSARMVYAQGEAEDIDRDFRSLGTTGLYPTADGQLYLTTTATHFWCAFCEIAGLPELATDPRYDTTAKRAQRSDELVPLIAKALLTHSAEEWESIFGDRVPCAVVRNIEDVSHNPQVAAEGLLARMPHPTLGTYAGVNKPVTFTASPCPPAFAAPTFGQHSRRILEQHGYGADEIDALTRRGVIRE